MSDRPKKKRLAPLPVRATQAQKDEIDRRADASGMSRSAYILRCVLGEDALPPKRRTRPVRDHEPLAQVLALLGRSRIASNLNQLAAHANAGGLIEDPELGDMLAEARLELSLIRRLLEAALGRRAGSP